MTTAATNAAATPAAHTTPRPAYAVSTALKTGAIAGVAAAVVNVIVSAIARGPFGASDDFAPLTPGPIMMWTILGALIGAAGWRLIVNKKADSRSLLNKLVPTVLVLSLVPDLALLASDSMAGQTTGAVLALMVMHVLTAAIVVAGYRRFMPPA
jgi:NADH:ubiquinone oxidoreductase subunit K